MPASDTIVSLNNFLDGDKLSLGSGYNFAKDAAVQLNVFPKDVEGIVSRRDTPSSRTLFCVNETSSEKLSRLNISGSAKAGILFGLFKVEGNFSFLKSSQSNERKVTATLVFICESRQEHVVIDHAIPHLDPRMILSVDTDATHVVTKVVFGGYAICNLDYELKASESIFEVEAGFSAALKTFGLLDVEVSGAGGYGDNKSDFLSNCKLTMSGTFIDRNTLPTDPREAIQLFHRTPSLLSKDSHIRYELTGLDAIRARIQSPPHRKHMIFRLLDEQFVEDLLSVTARVQEKVKKAELAALNFVTCHGNMVPRDVSSKFLKNKDSMLKKMIRLLKETKKMLLPRIKDAEDSDSEGSESESGSGSSHLQKVVGMAGPLEEVAQRLEDEISSYRKFITNDIVPGIPVVTDEQDVMSAVAKHLREHPSGRVFVFTEDFTQRQALPECRSIMDRLKRKYAEDPTKMFIIRIAESPFRCQEDEFFETDGSYRHDIVVFSNEGRTIGFTRNWESSPAAKSTSTTAPSCACLANIQQTFSIFDDLDDAIANKESLKFQIPGRFEADGFGRKLSDGTIEKVNPAIVEFHNPSRENHNENIRANQDYRENIVSYVSGFGHLSAILFLMKPNAERLTSAMMYGFIETLTNFNRDLASSIFLVFTLTSTTNYDLAGTRTTLQELERTLSTPHSKLDLLVSERMFFLDNAGFRLAAAYASGFVLANDPDGELFKINRLHWRRTSTAVRQLLVALLAVPPVSTQGVKELTRAKILITNVADVLVKIAQTIDENVVAVGAKKVDVEDSKKRGRSLEDRLTVNVRKFKVVTLDRPRTVCTNSTCFKVVTGDLSTSNEIQHFSCHSPCYLNGIPLNQANHPHLRKCSSMMDGKCLACASRGHNCSYEMHKHMVTDLEFFEEVVEVQSVKDDINKNKLKMNEYEMALQSLDAMIQKLEGEKSAVLEATAKCVTFVQLESLVTPNDQVIGHFKVEIAGLERVREKTPQQEKALENLRKLKQRYEAELELLTTYGSKTDPKPEKISIAAMQENLTALYKLEHFGKEIKACIGKLQAQASSGSHQMGSDGHGTVFDLDTELKNKAKKRVTAGQGKSTIWSNFPSFRSGFPKLK
ncbi:hypothetical protein DFJ73DRAFT_892122 [Zopfochytrium polystomum]|nr:hypothetical protein DFJ73DRAFT_892122 [Zopfochytrium polystomum]